MANNFSSKDLHSSVPTSWKISKDLSTIRDKQISKFLESSNLSVDGKDLAPPIKNFKQLNLPIGLFKALQIKGVKKPTAIQSQGLPIVYFFICLRIFERQSEDVLLKESNMTTI